MEIYYWDLNDDAKVRLLAELNVSRPEDFNREVVPVAVVEVDEDWKDDHKAE